MVNTKHDTGGYDRSCYQREIFNGNSLYNAFIKSRRGCGWKPQVQQFEMNLLPELAKMRRELAGGAYQLSPTTSFILHERGKTRQITGESIRDRVAKHALCDGLLSPAIKKYLIYDNGASQPGKGVDFARRRLLAHLRRYYAGRGSNEGYVLLMDFSKYYDNIRHDILLGLFRKYVDDPAALDLLEKALAASRVDVSYLTEEEYSGCLETVFDALKHSQVDKALLTGKKWMPKHLNIGDQVAQVAGICYPMEIDNYIKIVKAVKFYGRYMDDSYIIHESREYLQRLLEEITQIARGLGIFINARKTRICWLGQYWRFLQVQYSLTESGRVLQKINPKRLTALRRKMKKLARLLPGQEFANWYGSWFRSNYKIMSRRQRANLDALFHQLKEGQKTCGK